MSEQNAPPPWWHGAALYQVYVRSWRDSDGDGYGDLRGVIYGLDYLEWLGVDGVWLSPTMPSPDDDWGYDVADYRGVHEELGSLADLDELVAEADRRGLRLLLDLVPNHTSSAHAWFVEARVSRSARYREYYVWADPGPGGGVPNNWLDHTGASAWTFDEGTGQYYLHNFLESQPDLNWWNPEVHAEFEDILRFWLDRGIAGFRIDVAHGLYKDADLTDDPTAESSDVRGRNGLVPVRSANQPEVHGVYRRWREILEERVPPGVLLGETWVLDVAALASYYGAGDELDLAFNFPFVFAPFTASALREVVDETLTTLPPGSIPVWMASNHDISRFPTRWCAGDDAKVRLALTVLMTLPGTVVLYYGDEIGMVDVDVPVDRQRDAMTRGGRGRDGFSRDFARTPMQWERDADEFTTAPGGPWLPAGDNASRNVADQKDRDGSTLTLARSLLALRREAMGGTLARYEELDAGPEQWVYRSGPLVVAANFSDGPSRVAGVAERVLASSGSRPAGERLRDGSLGLEPWEAVVTAGAAAGPSSGETEGGTLRNSAEGPRAVGARGKEN